MNAWVNRFWIAWVEGRERQVEKKKKKKKKEKSDRCKEKKI